MTDFRQRELENSLFSILWDFGFNFSMGTIVLMGFGLVFLILCYLQNMLLNVNLTCPLQLISLLTCIVVLPSSLYQFCLVVRWTVLDVPRD